MKWFERLMDSIDPCQLNGDHGARWPCLVSYGCRWTWFRKAYWGKDIDD
jgi:hypothetical protein